MEERTRKILIVVSPFAVIVGAVVLVMAGRGLYDLFCGVMDEGSAALIASIAVMYAAAAPIFIATYPRSTR